MKENTKEWITILRTADWLSNLGQAVEDPSVVVVQSWEEARSLMEGDWDIVLHETCNAFRIALVTKDKNAFQTWDAVAPEIEQTVESLIQEKFNSIPRSERQPPYLEEGIALYLTYGLLEQEYESYVRPNFYTWLMFWISRGRMPCGWIEEFPNGQLVIF